jgi:small subunit ribosomal protein S6
LATLHYELILMLDPQAGDEQRDQIAADTKSRLEGAATIEHEANWGIRKMAYEIDRRPEADYRFYRFTTEGSALLDDLGHALKITEGVLRHRIFKTEHDAPTMTPPDTEQIMKRDEDDRDRGRGRGGDRGGPRRPRPDAGGDRERRPEAAPAPAPAEAAPAPAEAAEAAEAAPAEAAPEPAPAPAEAAPAPAAEPAAAAPDPEA